MLLYIQTHHFDVLHHESNRVWPREACAMLIGTRTPDATEIKDIVIAENTADCPCLRFDIDEKSLFAAHRRARDRGLETLGCFHSHPQGIAKPSVHDAARAFEPEQLWLIGGYRNLLRPSRCQPQEKTKPRGRFHINAFSVSKPADDVIAKFRPLAIRFFS